jgi:hypothetical protein
VFADLSWESFVAGAGRLWSSILTIVVPSALRRLLLLQQSPFVRLLIVVVRKSNRADSQTPIYVSCLEMIAVRSAIGGCGVAKSPHYTRQGSCLGHLDRQRRAITLIFFPDLHPSYMRIHSSRRG